SATLTVRFANGTTTNRPMDIAVNGTTVASAVAFNGTGAWTTWQNVDVTANLNAGANTVRATATTANGGDVRDRHQVLHARVHALRRRLQPALGRLPGADRRGRPGEDQRDPGRR